MTFVCITVENGIIEEKKTISCHNVYLYKTINKNFIEKFLSKIPRNTVLLNLDEIDVEKSFVKNKGVDLEKLQDTPLVVIGELSYRNIRLIKKAQLGFLPLSIF